MRTVQADFYSEILFSSLKRVTNNQAMNSSSSSENDRTMKTTHKTKHEEPSNQKRINRNSLPREAKKKADNYSTLTRIDYENLTKNAPKGSN